MNAPVPYGGVNRLPNRGQFIDRAKPVHGMHAAAARTHTVIKGDTLFSLAQRYYGNRSRWRDIYAANRDVLPSENALRIGMELKIP